jgi:hypothetical protein
MIRKLIFLYGLDLAMSKGIAVEFKKRFGGVEELKKQARTVGEVAVLSRPAKSNSGEKPAPRFIYYMITKLKYFHKPTYQTFEKSMIAMRNHMGAKAFSEFRSSFARTHPLSIITSPPWSQESLHAPHRVWA